MDNIEEVVIAKCYVNKIQISSLAKYIGLNLNELLEVT